MMILDINTS